jgi:predicted amidohydrolase YtcJ
MKNITAFLNLSLVIATGLLAGCGKSNVDTQLKSTNVEPPNAIVQQEPLQQTIYSGGDIITMVGDTPQYAEAVVVEGGKIKFVGTVAEAKNAAGKGPKMIDLAGQTMLPGFIDAHGHVFNSGMMAVAANLLPAPDGDTNSIDKLIANMNTWKGKNPNIIEKFGVILGMGYE